MRAAAEKSASGIKKGIQTCEVWIPEMFGPYVAYAPFGLEEVINVTFLTSLRTVWAILDLNRAPKDYESSALTEWANGPSLTVYNYNKCTIC